MHSITGYVTINGDMRVNGGGQYLCDTLVVTGNFYADNPTFEIGPNGLLIVLGDYIGVSGTITNGARVVFAGDFTQPYDLSGAGTYYVFDDSPTVPGWFGTTTYDEADMQSMDAGLYAFYSSVACGGGITGGSISGDQSVCSGDDVAAFASTSAASPASGTTYQWYSSTNSSNPSAGTWSLTGGATNETYDHGTISQTTYFYRKATAGSGCSANSNVLTISVTALNTAGAGSSSPTVCEGQAFTPVTHATTSIGTATGLPTGVNAAWAGNTITISGTPTSPGIYNYSIPLTGGCGIVNATGTLTVYSIPLTEDLFRIPNK